MYCTFVYWTILFLFNENITAQNASWEIVNITTTDVPTLYDTDQYLMETTDPIAEKRPLFKSHFPNYGPVSGGTQVIISWEFTEIAAISAANLITLNQDRDLDRTMEIQASNSSHISLKTSAVADTFVGIVWEIHLDYRTQFHSRSINTGMQFVYRGDPVIMEIFPRSSFISGGIALTAIGQNLDSVARPVMVVHMETTTIYTNQTSDVNVYTFRSNETYVYNTTAIVGITPVINLSVTSMCVKALESDDKIKNLCRMKRSGSGMDPGNPINSNTIDFDIGFELDGVTKFENLSEALGDDKGKLQVFVEPEIEQLKQTLLFDPKTDTRLTLKGKRLTYGATKHDYDVIIGPSSCEIVDMTDNAIFCTPTTLEPKSGPYDLKVLIGYLSFNIGKINYVEEKRRSLILIGSLSAVIAVVVLVFAIIIAVCCCRKSKTGDSNKVI